MPSADCTNAPCRRETRHEETPGPARCWSLGAAGGCAMRMRRYSPPGQTIASLSGEQIYDHICLGCHMAGGTGADGRRVLSEARRQQEVRLLAIRRADRAQWPQRHAALRLPADAGQSPRHALERCANRRGGQLRAQPFRQQLPARGDRYTSMRRCRTRPPNSWDPNRYRVAATSVKPKRSRTGTHSQRALAIEGRLLCEAISVF